MNRDGTTSGADRSPAKGGEETRDDLLTSGHMTRADLRLLRRAVDNGWNPIGAKKKRILNRLHGIIEKTEVAVPSGEGSFTSEAVADQTAIKAANVLVAMDRNDIAALAAASRKEPTAGPAVQVNINLDHAIECELARLASGSESGNAGQVASDAARRAEIEAATRAALEQDCGPAPVCEGGGNRTLANGQAHGGNGHGGNGSHS